jgi:hypothetical protein
MVMNYKIVRNLILSYVCRTAHTKERGIFAVLYITINHYRSFGGGDIPPAETAKFVHLNLILRME